MFLESQIYREQWGLFLLCWLPRTYHAECYQVYFSYLMKRRATGQSLAFSEAIDLSDCLLSCFDDNIRTRLGSNLSAPILEVFLECFWLPSFISQIVDWIFLKPREPVQIIFHPKESILYQKCAKKQILSCLNCEVFKHLGITSYPGFNLCWFKLKALHYNKQSLYSNNEKNHWEYWGLQQILKNENVWMHYNNENWDVTN